MDLRTISASIVILFAAMLPLYGGMYDEADMLESGKLYRVRTDRKLPCEYLQITLADNPAEFRPDKKRLVRVLLLGSDKKTVLQRLDVNEFDGCTAEQGDFNFDGYRDFRSFLWEQSGTGGRYFVHFIFDPKKRRYVSCPELDKLSTPYPDYQRKLIMSYSRGGGMYSVAQEHQWVNGKLVVVSEVWRGSDDEGWFTEYSTFENGVKKHSKRIHLHDE